MKYSLVALLLVACGDDSGVHALPDAPISDGTLPSGGAVAVTVYRQDSPLALRDSTASVLVHAASGDEVARTSVDAQGTATIDVPTRGTLTVLQPLAPGSTYATTFLAPAAGDALVVGWSRELATGSALVTLPPPPAGFRDALVISGCGYGEANGALLEATVQVRGTCADAPVLARVTATGNPDDHRYLVSAPVTLAPDAVVTLTGTWSTATTLPVTLANMPSGTLELAVQPQLGERLAATTLHTAAFDLATISSTELSTPPLVGPTLVSLRVAQDTHSQVALLRPQTPPSSLTLDGADLLPFITALSDAGTTLELELSPGAAYAGALLLARVQGTQVGVMWRVVTPPGTTAFTLPRIAELGDDLQIVEAGAALVAVSGVEPATVRAHLGSLTYVQTELPATSDLRISERQQ